MTHSAKKATITDVARLASVSISTVSRILNHQHTGDPEVRDRVNEAVQQLNYRPSSAARSLAGGSTLKTMNFVMQSLLPLETYFGDMLRGAEERAHELGANLYFSTAHNHLGILAKPGAKLKGFTGEAIQGLIFAGEMDQGFYHEIKRTGISVVHLNAYPRGETVNCVMCDNFAASYRVVRWLAGLGHRRIACINCGPPPVFVPSIEERVMGYRQALLDEGIDLHPEWMFRAGEYSIEEGYAVTERLLQVSPRPTAIFGTIDEVAVGAIRCAKAHGLRVPQDLSVVGVNDLEMARLCEPPLTTVRIFRQEIGRVGVQRLREVLRNPEERPRRIDVLCEFVLRESCAAPP
ncbi:MAG: LacI family DNA-binding transcriptional regulator [Candidatus Latescibacterota bacterium]|jgi:LacI family transcriptional regulator